MADDITIIVPPIEPVEPSTEETYEAIGEQLLSRLDQLDNRIEELSATILIYEQRIAELEGREFAAIEHTHEGFAETGHTHEEYATNDHQHESSREKRKADKEPESQHFYFRKLGE